MFQGCKGCLLAVALLLAACGNQSSWPSEPFDASKWAATPEEGRYVFARDLIDRRLLEGKGESEVVEMLGTPSSRDMTTITYLIKAGGSGFEQVYVLDIRVDPTRGTVISVLVRGD